MTSIASVNIASLTIANGKSTANRKANESFFATVLSDFGSELQNLATSSGTKVAVKDASVSISQGTYTPGAPGAPSGLQAALDAGFGTADFKGESVITITGDLTEIKQVNGQTESMQEPFSFHAVEGLPGQQGVEDSFSVVQPLPIVNGVVQPINPNGNFVGGSTNLSPWPAPASASATGIEVDALATQQSSTVLAFGNIETAKPAGRG